MRNTNAKQEFLEEIQNKELVCAKIGIDKTDGGRKIKWFYLKNNYSKEDFYDFCNKLDFGYDDGYGIQELYGTILFKDSYSDRFVYDGSECWDYHKIPTIEQVLKEEIK